MIWFIFTRLGLTTWTVLNQVIVAARDGPDGGPQEIDVYLY